MEQKKPSSPAPGPKARITLNADLSHLPVPTFITTETCGALSGLKAQDQVQKASVQKGKKNP